MTVTGYHVRSELAQARRELKLRASAYDDLVTPGESSGGKMIGGFYFQTMKVREEIRRRHILAFRAQHDAGPESEWDDDLRVMWTVTVGPEFN